MIDVIIPAYNAHDTIIQTLASVAIQSIRNKVKVYIVNDCSKKDYQNEIALFSDRLNIIELKTEKNGGAGYAKQFGIDNSNSKYIVFLDSDDQLYDYKSLETLYNHIVSKKLDIVMGYYYIEKENFKENFISDESYMYGCLHGKIYKRKHLEDNNIRFNNIRYNEDNIFNFLASNTTNKIEINNAIVYVNRYNKNSITHDEKKKIEIYSSYLYAMLWLVEELEKRCFTKDIIINLLVNSYTYIYSEVLKNSQVDFSYFYKQCQNFEKKYNEYEDFIDKEYVIDTLSIKLECSNNLLRNMLIENFGKFRKNFKKIR